MASNPDYFNGTLFQFVDESEYFIYPNGTLDPGSTLTILPDNRTILQFKHTDVRLDLALPVFTQLLDANRMLYDIPCIYPLSGQYDHLPRVLFYVLIIYVILFRHYTITTTAALGVIMSYSATACIHLFTLLGTYKFIPDPYSFSDSENAASGGDVDFWGIAPVVALSAIILIPFLYWSESFKFNSGKIILIYWSILIFASFTIVCYYTVFFNLWDIDQVWSFASCRKTVPILSKAPTRLILHLGAWKTMTIANALTITGYLTPRLHSEKTKAWCLYYITSLL